MKLVNLTPHAIVLRATDGAETVIPPSGTVARVAQAPGRDVSAHGEYAGLPVPVYSCGAWGEVEGLPPLPNPLWRRKSDAKLFHEVVDDIASSVDPRFPIVCLLADDGEKMGQDDGCWEEDFVLLPRPVYIVSALVLGRVSRLDVVAPGTGPQDGAIRNEKGQIIAVTCLIRSI